MATVKNAVPENGRLTTFATKQHVTMDHAQIARQQAPARTARAQTAPVTKVSALIARIVQQTLGPMLVQTARSIAVQTDHVLIVHTPSAQTAANHMPQIVPITPVSRQVIGAVIGAANARVAARPIGTASARQSS